MQKRVSSVSKSARERCKIGEILRVGHIKINAGIWINERTVIIKAKEPVARFYIDWVTVAFYN